MKEKGDAEALLEEKMDRWVYLNDLAQRIEEEKKMDDPKRMRQIPKMDQLMAQEQAGSLPGLTDIRKPCRLQGLLEMLDTAGSWKRPGRYF